MPIVLEGKIRWLHKLAGMEFLNKECEAVHSWCDRYKGSIVFLGGIRKPILLFLLGF
jgi:hypothetical protein